MSIDASLISYVVKRDALAEIQRAGVSDDDFVDEYRTAWRWIRKQKRDHGSVPSLRLLRTRFPDFEYHTVPNRDVPILLQQIRQRRKYRNLLESLGRAADEATSFEDVDSVIQSLQADLNRVSAFSADQKSHLVDLFAPETSAGILREIKRRRSAASSGIPTSLRRFDNAAGGLAKQKMTVIIGRPGLGKSWMDLLFVANAVTSGQKFILYPLEMTLFETAARLYTLFSQKLFGVSKVLRNYDITSGQVNRAKIVRFFHAMEDRFKGQLYVADVASLADPYTTERIEAEVDMHKGVDGFWVDYLTLLKSPQRGEDDWGAVRVLSNGIKNTAMRQDVVGGCSAQVNRQAMSQNVFLPRLEHIAYGDSIGQDADQVISINRTKSYLWYALVKNRGGPEFGKTRVRFDPDVGIIQEARDEDDDDA